MPNTDHLERSPLLHTKLLPPRLPPALLERPRLFQELQRGLERKLTVVSAAAGYGKSVLLASYLKASDLPFVWYNLDPGDRDPIVFLSYLIRGIEGRLKGFRSRALALLQAGGEQGPNRERVMATLINEILDSLPERLLIVLEDYHWVEESDGLKGLLDDLLKYLPPTLHLCLASRRKPNLHLSGLRSQGEIVELNAGALSFNDQEIRSLFAEVYRIPLSSQVLRQLEQQTEGWIMGLQLMAEALRGKSLEEMCSSLDWFKGSRGYLFHYLNEEVFQGLSAELQRFLKRSSILERFSAPLCASLLEMKDAPGLLDALLRRHLFLIGLDPEGHWYRYHHLFRDYLRGKLEREEGTEVVRGLHQKAARCWEALGERQEAISHYLQAGEFGAAADRIGGAVEEWIATAGPESLQTWLGQLPEAMVGSRARLLYARGRILYLKGHWEEAAAWFTLTKERAQVEDDRPIFSLALRFLTGLYQYSGSYELVESLACEGLKYLGTDSPFWPHISIVLAAALLDLNRPEEAGREWEQLLANPFVQKDDFLRFNCVSYMGPHYYQPLGRFEEAISIIQEGIDYFRHHDCNAVILAVMITLRAARGIARIAEGGSVPGDGGFRIVWDNFRDGFSGEGAGAKWFYFAAGLMLMMMG